LAVFFVGNCSIVAIIQWQFFAQVLMFLYWPVEHLIVLNYFIFDEGKKMDKETVHPCIFYYATETRLIPNF